MLVLPVELAWSFDNTAFRIHMVKVLLRTAGTSSPTMHDVSFAVFRQRACADAPGGAVRYELDNPVIKNGELLLSAALQPVLNLVSVPAH